MRITTKNFSDLLNVGFPVAAGAFPENTSTADFSLLEDLITGHINIV